MWLQGSTILLLHVLGKVPEPGAVPQQVSTYADELRQTGTERVHKFVQSHLQLKSDQMKDRYDWCVGDDPQLNRVLEDILCSCIGLNRRKDFHLSWCDHGKDHTWSLRK